MNILLTSILYCDAGPGRRFDENCRQAQCVARIWYLSSSSFSPETAVALFEKAIRFSRGILMFLTSIWWSAFKGETTITTGWLRCSTSTVEILSFFPVGKTATLNITTTVNCLETDLLNLKINVGIDTIQISAWRPEAGVPGGAARQKTRSTGCNYAGWEILALGHLLAGIFVQRLAC